MKIRSRLIVRSHSYKTSGIWVMYYQEYVMKTYVSLMIYLYRNMLIRTHLKKSRTYGKKLK